MQADPRVLWAGDGQLHIGIFLHVLVNLFLVVGAEPHLAVQLTGELERTALGLAVTADSGQILHRIGIQKFYDFVHDKYLQNGF